MESKENLSKVCRREVMNGIVLPSSVYTLSEKYFCRGKFEKEQTEGGWEVLEQENTARRSSGKKSNGGNCPDNTYCCLIEIVCL